MPLTSCSALVSRTSLTRLKIRKATTTTSREVSYPEAVGEADDGII